MSRALMHYVQLGVLQSRAPLYTLRNILYHLDISRVCLLTRVFAKPLITNYHSRDEVLLNGVMNGGNLISNENELLGLFRNFLLSLYSVNLNIRCL